jgi:ATP-dependent exoDNAse (exonuclease V) beta subunit
MPDAPHRTPPPDQAERERALDPARSILVRAPAGSGKTDLLTRRFLRLLGEVDDPGQIVAITFTRPAAAEMRNRILSELEKAAESSADKAGAGPFSTQALAHRALARSQALGWELLDLPAQLRIQTIDSFCRDLALQQPLLSGLGGGLDISEQPTELYRRAARRTLDQIAAGDPSLREAIEALLLWRDNSWPDLENQLVAMLEKRDQWMQDFVLDRDPDWGALRTRLERPFARAAEFDPSSSRYSEEEWRIVRACFTLLRHAVAELKVVFAEAATADFIEVAQIALNVLRGDDGLPTDGAQAVADGIRHLLVDEFQDTSRRQHQLLAHLIAAWPEREGRTCFVVGDPMQSIYFFRDADAELFPRVEQLGLEIPGDLPLRFDSVQLNANFRTAPPLVDSINNAFTQIFAIDDGSGVTYAQAAPARGDTSQAGPLLVANTAPLLQLHLEFIPESRGNSRSLGPDGKKELAAQRDAAQQKQIEEIVALIRDKMAEIERSARCKGKISHRRARPRTQIA